MRVNVNGEATELDREMSIGEFLRAKDLDGAAVAVEHNLRICMRDEWEATLLKENDRVEIVRMLGGG